MSIEPVYWQRPVLHTPTLQELVSREFLSSLAAEALSSVVRAGGRVLIVGGAKSGKTTLADALTSSIPLGAVIMHSHSTDLTRQGLRPIEAPKVNAPIIYRADGLVAASTVPLDASAIITLDGKLPVVGATLLGLSPEKATKAALSKLPFDIIVEVRRVKEEQTRRFLTHLLVHHVGELVSVEEGYLDPWGTPQFRRTENSDYVLTQALAALEMPNDGIVLGVSVSGKPVTLNLDDLSKNLLIAGNPGTGTTLSSNNILHGYSAAGISGVYLDSKNHNDYRQDFENLFPQGRALSQEEFNPLATLDAETIVELMLSTGEVAVGHDVNIVRRFLSQLVTLAMRGSDEMSPMNLDRIKKLFTQLYTENGSPVPGVSRMFGGSVRTDFSALFHSELPATRQEMCAAIYAYLDTLPNADGVTPVVGTEATYLPVGDHKFLLAAALAQVNTQTLHKPYFLYSLEGSDLPSKELEKLLQRGASQRLHVIMRTLSAKDFSKDTLNYVGNILLFHSLPEYMQPLLERFDSSVSVNSLPIGVSVLSKNGRSVKLRIERNH